MAVTLQRLANALEVLGGMLLLALIVGAVDGLLATPVAAESVAQRMGTFALLDALLTSPLALLAALVALLFPRRGRLRRALVPGGLLLVFGLGLSQVVQSTSTRGELTGAWLLEQPLPYLRSDPPRRAIALVSVDTLRADGLDDMPLLRARAQSGMRYTAAHSTSSWTLPAMASLHTGLAPAEHGAGARQGAASYQRSGLEPSVDTLAEALRRRGYVNAAVVTNPYLSLRYGLHRGFDRYIDLSRRALLQRGLRRSLLWKPWVPPASDDPTDRALQLHSRMHEGRSFLWVHYLEPHAPYTRLESDPHEDCALPDCYPDWRTEGKMEDIRALYRADLQRLDVQLDRLLAELIEEDRLVVLVADHGEEFGEHGGHAHGHSFYEEVTRIPLVVWAGETGTLEHNVDLLGVHDLVLRYSDGGSSLIPAGLTPMAGLLFGEESAACTDGRYKRIAGVGSFDLVEDPLEQHPLDESLLDCTLQPLQEREGSTMDPGVLRALGYVD